MSSGVSDALDRDLAAFFARDRDLPGADAGFNELALRVFAYQFEALAPYGAYCRHRGALPSRLRHWSEIPAVPTQAFKDVVLWCDGGSPGEGDGDGRDGRPAVEGAPARVFRTSGTTAGQRSGAHYMSPEALALYDASLLPQFRAFVLPDVAAGGRSRLVPLALTPSPEEAPHSSLSYMIDRACGECFQAAPRYFLRGGELDFDGLCQALGDAAAAGVCLLTTDLALDRFLEAAEGRGFHTVLAAGSRLMHTGGPKGRRRSVSWTALAPRIEAVLGLSRAWCVNEYGMTEMASQFYEDSIRCAVTGTPARAGLKFGPAWTRTLVVDVRTLEPVPPGSPGLLRHFDLANRGSVLALQTEDLGVAHPTSDDPEGDGRGPFELRGRAEGSEARGCSLDAESSWPERQPVPTRA